MDNSFKKIISEGLKSLSDIFHKDKNSFSSLGIDIGSSAIKVVQIQKKDGKAVLETYGALALGPYANTDIGSVTNLNPENISKALLDVIRESKVTINSGVIAIPSSSSLVFTISLPSKISENELHSVVPIEARKYIPVPISEVTLDWSIIPQEPESFTDGPRNFIEEKIKGNSHLDILVVAIHNGTLSRYQEILSKTKLQSDSFEMEIFANIRSSISHDLSPVLIMDFGASKTKILIVEAGVVRKFHVVNRGSYSISKNIAQSLRIPFIEAEKLKRSIGLTGTGNPEVKDIVTLSIDYIFSDTKSVVFAYEKKYNKTISKVVLTGGGSLLKGLLEQAQKDLSVEVSRTNPFSKTEAPAFLQPILEESGPEFSVAVGLALRQLL